MHAHGARWAASTPGTRALPQPTCARCCRLTASSPTPSSLHFREGCAGLKPLPDHLFASHEQSNLQILRPATHLPIRSYYPCRFSVEWPLGAALYHYKYAGRGDESECQYSVRRCDAAQRDTCGRGTTCKCVRPGHSKRQILFASSASLESLECFCLP